MQRLGRECEGHRFPAGTHPPVWLAPRDALAMTASPAGLGLAAMPHLDHKAFLCEVLQLLVDTFHIGLVEVGIPLVDE